MTGEVVVKGGLVAFDWCKPVNLFILGKDKILYRDLNSSLTV